MAGPYGPRKRGLRPSKKPKTARVLRRERKAEIKKAAEFEHPAGSAHPVEAVVVASAPEPAGGSVSGALPRLKKRRVSPAVKAALDRAVATSEGKEPPPRSEASVDPALRREFGAAAREKEAAKPEEAPAAPATPGTTMIDPDSEPIMVGGARLFPLTRKALPPETAYDPSFDELARQFIGAGATETELAELLNVSPRTILRWKHAHVGFRAAIRLGR